MGSQDSMSGPSMGNNLSASDKKFVLDAAKGGMAEVELGKLATEKAASDDVKKFGQRMVDDHTKANDQLKQVAQQEGIQLPTGLSSKDEMTKERLSKLSGAAFDKAYMNDMVNDHVKDVADFQKESTSGKDPAVKSFASQTLPTLQSHLQEAKRIAPTTSNSASR
jgi:putative membrane protein